MISVVRKYLLMGFVTPVVVWVAVVVAVKITTQKIKKEYFNFFTMY